MSAAAPPKPTPFNLATTVGINMVTCYDARKIGGELVRWNTTRFDTIFIFLQSFLDRKDKFKLWMASADWEHCKWAGEEDHDFTYDCLTKNKWWTDMAKINKNLCDRLMQVINRRLEYMLNDTLMLGVVALNPEALYTSKMARKPKFQYVVTMAIKKLSNSSSKVLAVVDQYTFFRKQTGLFGGEEAKDSALNGRASAGGGDDEDGDPSGPSSVARPPTHVAIDQYNAPGQDEQPTPLRPRSKRQNKLSVKGMYMFEKVNDMIFKHKHKNMSYAWIDSMARF
ncbi:hypothetical protein ZEAMMB73_Zm00001d022455 [Zea mays]|uniref:Uncharacterized protein n=1 Tax=Zea mays TaxID=4577 RepID=A0A1D6IMZ5_MAIZE|nr:hypothetical protein ZEAMMB73_Zm00001d022455 [Zea mays]